MLVLTLKPLKKLTGMDRQTGRQVDGQDHVLSHALTKTTLKLTGIGGQTDRQADRQIDRTTY